MLPVRVPVPLAASDTPVLVVTLQLAPVLDSEVTVTLKAAPASGDVVGTEVTTSLAPVEQLAAKAGDAATSATVDAAARRPASSAGRDRNGRLSSRANALANCVGPCLELKMPLSRCGLRYRSADRHKRRPQASRPLGPIPSLSLYDYLHGVNLTARK